MTPQHATASSSPFLKNPLTSPRSILPETVAVVGLGYVGLPLAILSHARGYPVFGIDIDAAKRASIASASIPDLEDAFRTSLIQDPFPVLGNFAEIANANIIIVCVPTPVDEDHNPDLTPVTNSCERIAAHMRKGQLIILESTVHPGTCEEVVIPILEEKSGLKAGIDFQVAHCPERVNPGDKYWPLQRIPRVIGATTPEALEHAAAFYRSVLDALVYEMATIREAEAVKVVENSFRDINIAFVNELAMSFSKLGIDVVNVIEGAATKPFGFMAHYPGCGVGGHCIPVDPYYLIRYAKQNGFSHEFLALGRTINNGMPDFTISLLAEEFKKRKDAKVLHGSTVALLGLSYKANVSDMRESPAFEIWKLLEADGVTVRAFDPFSKERSTVASMSEALRGADAVIVATAHSAIRALTPQMLMEHGISIIIDGRNCLVKEQFTQAGIAYRGIGR